MFLVFDKHGMYFSKVLLEPGLIFSYMSPPPRMETYLLQFPPHFHPEDASPELAIQELAHNKACVSDSKWQPEIELGTLKVCLVLSLLS
jgi:hypothetical protein